MAQGYLFLAIAILGYGLLGIFHKLADHPSCRPKFIAVILLFWAAVLTTIYTGATGAGGGLIFPRAVLWVGLMGGVFSSLALASFQAGLKYGKISTSWLVLNLSMSIPILLSIFLFDEGLNLAKAAGLLLVLTAILFLWWDKKRDLDVGDHGNVVTAGVADATTAAPVAPATPSGGPAAEVGLSRRVVAPSVVPSKWLPLMLLAFLANGLGASSQKVLVEQGVGAYSWQFLIVLYWSGFLFMGLISLKDRAWPNRRELWTALAMSVASVAANVALVKALDHHVPGSIAYPVGNGGSLFLVVVAGVFFFRERLSGAGIAGVALGISAILVLTMS